jgi:hypothetical protein
MPVALSGGQFLPQGLRQIGSPIGPKPTVVDFNEWVPWATRADDFDKGHYIEVGNTERFFECGGTGLCPRFSF